MVKLVALRRISPRKLRPPGKASAAAVGSPIAKALAAIKKVITRYRAARRSWKAT